MIRDQRNLRLPILFYYPTDYKICQIFSSLAVYAHTLKTIFNPAEGNVRFTRQVVDEAS